jgi:hypothetical protein
MASPTRLLASFGRFWWDFLIGENPAAFIGTIAVIVAALLLRHERAAAVVVVPLIAIAFLLVSTYRARQRPTSS